MLTSTDDDTMQAHDKSLPNVLVSRNLVASTCRLLHNVVIDHGQVALQQLYAERVQDALLLACLLPFAEMLENTWVEEGDEGVAEYLDMLAEVVAVVRVAAWTDKKFCRDVSESENVCRALLAAVNVQMELLSEIINPVLIINIFHVFYLCLQINLPGFSKLFVRLLRPEWAHFADTIFAILNYSQEKQPALRIDSMEHIFMEIIFSLLHSQYGASFQDLLELPYATTTDNTTNSTTQISPATVLDVLGLKLLDEQRQARQSMRVAGDTSRHLMQLMRVSAKARRFIVAAGEIEATMAALRAMHADLKPNYRGPMRVLDANALSPLELSAMVQWLRLLLQMMYDNVEAKRIAAKHGLTLLIIRLWPTLMQYPWDREKAVGPMSELRTVILQILMTFTAGCSDAGVAMVQPLYDDKPSVCLLQFILRDLLQQLSRTIRPNMKFIAILFGIVCQCSFYSHCRVLIRSQPTLLRTISLARPATSTILHANSVSGASGGGAATAGDDDRCKNINLKKLPISLNNKDFLFETTVRNLTFDLLVCLSYSEDGQFYICATMTPNASAINTLYEIARAPAEFGVKAAGSAMLVLRNFCFNRALLTRIAVIPGLMPFLAKFLLGPVEGFDARTQLLATSILIELCANRLKLRKEFSKMEIDLDSILRFADVAQHVILLHKLKKIFDKQPRARQRRIRRGPILPSASTNDVEYYAAEPLSPPLRT